MRSISGFGKRMYIGIMMLLAGWGIMPLHASAAAGEEVRAELAFPTQGITWITQGGGDGGISVAGESLYKGKPVYTVTTGRKVSILDKSSRNWMVSLYDNKEIASASPHNGELSFPLFVGKSWTASYFYEDHQRQKSWDILARWKVEAFEDVQVPAGRFKAFRLKSSPGQNNSVTATLWYAPELKMIIKRISERDSSHYLGAGSSVTELMEYLPH